MLIIPYVRDQQEIPAIMPYELQTYANVLSNRLHVQIEQLSVDEREQDLLNIFQLMLFLLKAKKKTAWRKIFGLIK